MAPPPKKKRKVGKVGKSTSTNENAEENTIDKVFES